MQTLRGLSEANILYTKSDKFNQQGESHAQSNRAMKKKAVEYSITAKKQDFEIVKVRSSIDAYGFAKKFYHEDILIYESAFIMLLNHVNNVTGYAKISQGGICTTQIDIRLVAKYAIDSLAAAVIFVHNHPSGNLKPSHEDEQLTTRMKDALGLLGIKLVDSLIISDTGYLSMNDEGLL